MTEIMIPTIHMNGTSREALLSAYEEAMTAIAAALRALEETAPNGRDYYPQGPDAIGAAIAQHYARAATLGRVRAELCAIAESIA